MDFPLSEFLDSVASNNCNHRQASYSSHSGFISMAFLAEGTNENIIGLIFLCRQYSIDKNYFLAVSKD